MAPITSSTSHALAQEDAQTPPYQMDRPTWHTPTITQQSHGPTQKFENTTCAAMQPLLGGQRATALPTAQSALELNNRLVDGGDKRTEAKHVGTNAEADAGPRVGKQKGQRQVENFKQTIKDQHHARTNWAQHINKYNPKTKLEDTHEKNILQFMCRHHRIGTFVGAPGGCNLSRQRKRRAAQDDQTDGGATRGPYTGLGEPDGPTTIEHGDRLQEYPMGTTCQSPGNNMEDGRTTAMPHCMRTRMRKGPPNTRTGTCTRKTRYEIPYGMQDLQGMCRTRIAPPKTDINQCSRNRAHGKTDGESGKKPT